MSIHVIPLKEPCGRLYTCVGLKTRQVLCLPLRLAVMLEKVCPSARLIQLSVAHLAMYPRLSTCVADVQLKAGMMIRIMMTSLVYLPFMLNFADLQ